MHYLQAELIDGTALLQLENYKKHINSLLTCDISTSISEITLIWEKLPYAIKIDIWHLWISKGTCLDLQRQAAKTSWNELELIWKNPGMFQNDPKILWNNPKTVQNTCLDFSLGPNRGFSFVSCSFFILCFALLY